jgi:hypothetical protein
VVLAAKILPFCRMPWATCIEGAAIMGIVGTMIASILFAKNYRLTKPDRIATHASGGKVRRCDA